MSGVVGVGCVDVAVTTGFPDIVSQHGASNRT